MGVAEHDSGDEAGKAPLRSLRTTRKPNATSSGCGEQRNADRYPVGRGRDGDDTNANADGDDADAKQRVRSDLASPFPIPRAGCRTVASTGELRERQGRDRDDGHQARKV